MNPRLLYKSNDQEQDETEYVLYKELDLFPHEHIYGLHTYEKLDTDSDTLSQSTAVYTVLLNDAFYKSFTDYHLAQVSAYKKIQKIANQLNVTYRISIKQDIYKLKVNGLEISRVTINFKSS